MGIPTFVVLATTHRIRAGDLLLVVGILIFSSTIHTGVVASKAVGVTVAVNLPQGRAALAAIAYNGESNDNRGLLLPPWWL